MERPTRGRMRMRRWRQQQQQGGGQPGQQPGQPQPGQQQPGQQQPGQQPGQQQQQGGQGGPQQPRPQQGPPRTMAGQPQPIQPGPPNPVAIQLANFLRGQNLKPRTSIFNGERKEMFRGKPALSSSSRLLRPMVGEFWSLTLPAYVQSSEPCAPSSLPPTPRRARRTQPFPRSRTAPVSRTPSSCCPCPCWRCVLARSIRMRATTMRPRRRSESKGFGT